MECSKVSCFKVSPRKHNYSLPHWPLLGVLLRLCIIIMCEKLLMVVTGPWEVLLEKTQNPEPQDPNYSWSNGNSQITCYPPSLLALIS